MKNEFKPKDIVLVSCSFCNYEQRNSCVMEILEIKTKFKNSNVYKAKILTKNIKNERCKYRHERISLIQRKGEESSTLLMGSSENEF